MQRVMGTLAIYELKTNKITLTAVKTTEPQYRRRFGTYIVNFEHV